MSIIEMPEDEPWRPKNRIETSVTPREPVGGAAEALVYTGGRWRVFWIALSRMIVTILTLGVGRFWMTTRLRRHYWSSIRIGGEPLEYTGRAGEKLIGFLIAVVILAAYLMVVNLTLTFVGLSVFQGNLAALQLPLLALIPFVPWAQYRARRYILARTRWRGLRFGMVPGAWAYVGRSLLWGFLTLITLGFLYPLMQYRLAQFVAERSRYGDLAFEQRGGWIPLLKSWLWVWAPIPILAIVSLAIGGAYLGADEIANIASGENPFEGEGDDANPFGVVAGVFGGVALVVVLYFWMIFAWVHHQVFSFRHINSNRVLGGRARIEFRLGVWPVIAIYLLAGFVIAIGVGVVASLFAGLGFGVATVFGLNPDGLAGLSEGGLPGLDAIVSLALVGVFYLPAIATYIGLNHAFITHPLIAEAARSATVHDLDAADAARQRAHDDQAEAGGFADALGADVGGAF